MKTKTMPYLCRTGMLLVLVLAVCGCAGQPFDPPKTGEIPEGPGVFTDNPEGEVVIRVGEENSKSKTATTDASSSASGPPGTAGDSDYAEFEAYRQWLEWKRSAEGSPEYEEFQEWREWRRYREWKQQN